MVVQVPNNLIFVFIVINNNEKASFDEVLDKTKSEIEKSHGDITKNFKMPTTQRIMSISKDKIMRANTQSHKTL